AMLAETIHLTGWNGDRVEAYLARPLSPQPRGGVVVIHHMPGWSFGMKEITRRFAAEGYLALCPNLHYRDAPGASPDDPAASSRRTGPATGRPPRSTAGRASPPSSNGL